MTRLVYLSPVRLASFAQRSHHFIEWMHRRHGCEVLWLEPYPVRLPRLGDLHQLRAGKQPDLGPAWTHESWIERLDVPALPAEPLAPGRALNAWFWKRLFDRLDDFIDESTWIVIAKPSALAIKVLDRYPSHRTAFDVMDNVPAFNSGLSRRWLEHAEIELAQRCDWILVSSTALQTKFAQYRHKLRLIPNGLTIPPPLDSATNRDLWAQQPGLIFGYLGVIGSWFDWTAIIELAVRFPDATVKLVGPVHCRVPTLPRNVELHPPVPQHQVYDALKEFSVGLIPFIVNELTEFVDPVKYYEYGAMGIPILSSRFGEMRLRGKHQRVLFFDQLQADASLPHWFTALQPASQIDAFRRDHCWTRRFDQLDMF